MYVSNYLRSAKVWLRLRQPGPEPRLHDGLHEVLHHGGVSEALLGQDGKGGLRLPPLLDVADGRAVLRVDCRQRDVRRLQQEVAAENLKERGEFKNATVKHQKGLKTERK